MIRFCFLSLMLLLVSSGHAEEKVDYQRDVKPILSQKCFACHGALKQESGLRLDAAGLIQKGSENGEVVKKGEPSESSLYQRMSTDDSDERMPPEGEGEALNEQQLLVIKRWIEQGAVLPLDEPIPPRPSEHWAYKLPVRPDVPLIIDIKPSNRNSLGLLSSSLNPIDRFIAESHRQKNLTPLPTAERHLLLRRLHIDLIGLPPTKEELQAFLDDRSEDAYEQTVDRLLKSPHYGERWGRHWMDVWRYSDWSGYRNQLRGSQRHIWRWRDWIIESLNEDRGYDEMIREMLAGDELAPADINRLRATGFLARNYHNSNRNIWLDATVEHTAKAFMGITINCARCHDHKYDPISQEEYYRLRAIFEPHQVRTERLPGQPDIMKNGLARVFDSDLNAKTFLYERGNEKVFDKENPVPAGLPSIFEAKFDPQPIQLPSVAVLPNLQSHIEKEELAKAEQKLKVAQAALKKGTVTSTQQQKTSSQQKSETLQEFNVKLLQARVQLAESELHSLQARWKADRLKYQSDRKSDHEMKWNSAAQLASRSEKKLQVFKTEADRLGKQVALMKAEQSSEKDAKKKQTAIAKARAELKKAEETLKKAKAALLSHRDDDVKYTSVGKAYPKTSSGRRLALANWIASPKNPLTARVAVNHIWMRHFGRPLVPNVFDFGLKTPRPVHAKLLDWLAVELMEHDWSMKHLHRLIVTSRLYRLSSSGDESLMQHNLKIDPDNHFYWQANVQRLDAEIVRDSLLYLSGSLDRTFGGADLDFQSGEKIPRRSIYFRHAYEKQMTMLVVFDVAGPSECYRRSPSIIPQQALVLSNSPLAIAQSRKLAGSLWKEILQEEKQQKRDPIEQKAEFVKRAFLQLLTREPTEQETASCLKFLRTQTGRLKPTTKKTGFSGRSTVSIPPAKDPRMRARENLVHVLFNHNDFVTVR